MSEKQAAPGAGLYPYPDPDMRLEGDVRAALKRALGLRDEDFDRIVEYLSTHAGRAATAPAQAPGGGGETPAPG